MENFPATSSKCISHRTLRSVAVSDFTTELSQLYERHAEELQMLVAGYRKRNAELRKDRGACQTSLFQTWDILLQEVEKDSQAHSDIASVLGRQVARPLLEKTFHRKIQSRKVFGTREAYEQFVAKAEEKLVKARQDYKNAYMSYMASPNTAALATYFDAHNAYVTQLHATNGILEHFGTETLPSLMQELEDIYADLCATLTDAALQGAEVISSRVSIRALAEELWSELRYDRLPRLAGVLQAQEQQRRYDGLAAACRSASAQADIVQVVKSLAPQGAHPHPVVRRHFSAPHVPPPDADAPGNDLSNTMLPPALKNELVTDRLASIQVRVQLESLRKEGQDLELQCKQLTDALDTLHRMQQRSLESSLFNKANELQDEISVKKYDLRVAQMQLASVRAQVSVGRAR
ncbi:F-BAR and double SH3 domains protein 1, partial [Frankliniella fusca]